MVGYATKGDNSDLLEFQDCCSVFRAWDTQLKETEKFIKLVKDNCETLATRTLDSLTFLIAEKKSARKSYLDQRNQLDSQILKSQEDVQKNKTEYSRLMDRLKVEQAKYQDAQNKGETKSDTSTTPNPRRLAESFLPPVDEQTDLREILRPSSWIFLRGVGLCVSPKKALHPTLLSSDDLFLGAD